MNKKQINRMVHLSIYHPIWKVRKKNRKRCLQFLISKNNDIENDRFKADIIQYADKLIDRFDDIHVPTDKRRKMFQFAIHELLRGPIVPYDILATILCYYYLYDECLCAPIKKFFNGD